MSVQNEDDLLYLLYKEKKKSGHDVYPKVSEIPKGKESVIAPDIDLLEIRPHDIIKVIGYEVKFLNYRKTSKSFSLGEFYKGIGQILCYFQHGVEQAFLVLGLYGFPEDRRGVAEKTQQQLQKTWNFLEKWFPPLSYYSEVDFRKPYEDISLVFVPTTAFPVSFEEDVRYRHECLLRRKFTWAKKWLNEMERKSNPSAC